MTAISGYKSHEIGEIYINIEIFGASLSEPYYTIWPLEMVPWSMRETNTIKNGFDHRMCHPL